MPDSPFRRLPPVNEILQEDRLREALARHGHDSVAAAVRDELDRLRQAMHDGQVVDLSSAANLIAEKSANALARLREPRLRPVINATGIVLHTNLGRAPMAEAAAQAAFQAARGYLNLELSLETGTRI